MTNPSETLPLKQSFTIKDLGVGGAGCNAVSHLASDSFQGVSFAVNDPLLVYWNDGLASVESVVPLLVKSHS